MTNRFSARAEFFLNDPHRDAVTSSICHAKTILQSLKVDSSIEDLTACIFVAGYCNDLQISQLLKQYRRVCLVGSNQIALERGVAAQGLAKDDRISLVGDFDVSGIHFDLEQLSNQSDKNNADVTQLFRQVEKTNWNLLPQHVDVNASVCLISQMVMDIVEGIGEFHDQFVPLVQAIRRRHLELMLEQLKPGGIGLLTFDFVSSDTLPGLPELVDEPLQRTLSAAIDNNNFFHGMNPQIFLRLFETDLRDKVSRFQFSKPWVWKTSERAYAVAGIIFQRAIV